MIEKVVIGNAELYCGDCMEILPTLGKVDAVVTDPPYGIGWKPRVNHTEQPWVDVIDFDIKKILVGEKHIIWGAQYHIKNLPDSDSWLTWCKRPAELNSFSMDKRSYSTTEIAWTDFGKSGFFVHCWDGGKRAGVKGNREFCHPSQKPYELMLWCIERTGGAQIIFDPFMGSGTTGVACVKLGCKFIGIELEPKYFDIACERIQAAYDQPDMFIEPERTPEQLKIE